MRVPAERVEHLRCLLGVLRLAVQPAPENDSGVDAEHRPPVGPVGDRARLSERVLLDELDRVGLGRVVLLVVGRDDLEGNAELLEDVATLWRRRREQQRRRGRCAHPRLRARQISSHGHFFAHSAFEW